MLISICLLICLMVALWKCWTYRCLIHGLMYFAELNHDWEINENEIKKILDYSIKRNIKDFFKN